MRRKKNKKFKNTYLFLNKKKELFYYLSNKHLYFILSLFEFDLQLHESNCRREETWIGLVWTMLQFVWADWLMTLDCSHRDYRTSKGKLLSRAPDPSCLTLCSCPPVASRSTCESLWMCSIANDVRKIWCMLVYSDCISMAWTFRADSNSPYRLPNHIRRRRSFELINNRIFDEE